MMVLRQKIEEELDSMDHQSRVAVYEHLRQINRLRRAPKKQLISIVDIEELLELTSSSKTSWGEAVSKDREERL
jgi:hypothetical protein